MTFFAVPSYLLDEKMTSFVFNEPVLGNISESPGTLEASGGYYVTITIVAPIGFGR